MRCGCPDCGAYMTHAEGPQLGCVCPQCGRRCRDCLGLCSPLSREQLRALARDPASLTGLFRFDDPEEGPDFEPRNSM